MVDERTNGDGEPEGLEDAVVRFALLASGEEPVDLDEFCAGYPEAWRDELRRRCHEVERLRADLPRRDPEAAGAFPPERIGGYRIERELGRGGMGVVFLAHPEAGGEPVAIKVLLINALVTTRAVQRFRREMEATRELDHPGIVPVLDVGEEAGYLYLVMAHVPGPSLAQVLADRADADAPLPGAAGATNGRVAAIIAALADALHAAHERGLIHRDVKPANILFDADGEPKLFDFGLAKDLSEESLSVEGELAGTPSYMSPEQALGKRVVIDRRTDVFSLGVVLYEMLSGRRPFGGDTLHELFYEISFKEPPELRRLRPDVPRDLVTIAAKAMEKDPDHRFPTARAMAEDLRRFLNHESIVARPVGRARALARRARAHPALSSTAAALLLVVLALPLLLSWWGGRAAAEASLSTLSVTSDPPGARVSLRQLREDATYGPPVELGVTPLERARFEPGVVRLVVDGGEQGFAELMRTYVAPGTDYEVRDVVLRPTEEVVASLRRVAPGPFQGGSPDPPAGHPLRERRLDGAGFHVMTDEVTCAQYRAFLLATGRPQPAAWPEPYDARYDDLPAFAVPLEDARACAEWMGLRLPTYWEYQRLGRGTSGRTLPEGVEASADLTRHGLRGEARPYELDPALEDDRPEYRRQMRAYFERLVQPVGTGPLEGDAQLRHLLGNVAEWTETPDRPEWYRDPADDVLGPVVPEQFVFVAGDVRQSSYRFDLLQTRSRDTDVLLQGFRCAKSLTP